MSQRLRFLLDTNVLIPLQDSQQVLEDSLANFVRLASIGGHQLMYHPANIADFERDSNTIRRQRNLQRIRQYPALHEPAPCAWNSDETSPNDACDNELLYALHCDAANSFAPRSSSSSLIVRDNGDCSICSRSAARAKCSSSATARKQRRWRSSIEPRFRT